MLSLAFQSKKKRGRGGVTKILGRRLNPLLNVRGEVCLIWGRVLEVHIEFRGKQQGESKAGDRCIKR